MSERQRHNQEPFQYEGFSKPNGTIVPDDVFDVLAPNLSDAELRVLLYIIRRTFGFGKNSDAISLSQLTDGIRVRDGRILDQGTGLSRKAVIAGIKGLQGKGIIHVHKRTDERGEYAINVYSLRFREGVVTSSNYPSNPKTLPLVTPGYLQESVVQDSVEQQPYKSSREVASPTATGPSVVASEDNINEALYQTLCELGVHHHKARKLLREHPMGSIERLVEFLVYRLEQGWAPLESPAAWLVAAIRDGYEVPSSFRTREEAQAARQEDQAAEETLLAQATERQQAQTEECMQQRANRLLVLGIEQNVDKLWQQVQAYLRQQGQWSVSMALCFLKSLENGVAILLVPTSARKRLADHEATLTRALADFTGEDVTLVLKELPGG